MLFLRRPIAASVRIARCTLRVALVCCGSVYGWSQQPASTNRTADPAEVFAIETWSIERGMPQNSVTDLLQTHRGYLWVSTYNGIAQFDGERFTVFDSGNTAGLPNSRITSLFEDRSGNVWIGHDNGELTRQVDGRFESIPTGSEWTPTTISGIGADAAGDIWVLNVRAEAVRVRDAKRLPPPPGLADEPAVSPEMIRDQTGRLLVARNGYVAELTPDGFRAIDFDTSESRPYHARLAVARSGGLWVPGAGRVRRWDGVWREDLGPFPWGEASIMTMMESSAGHLLVGTLEAGLFIHTPETGWMNLNRTNGLPQDWVRCLGEDRERNVWVGSSGGLVVLRPRKVVMHIAPDAWQGRPVQAIAPAHDGAVWTATEGAGLYRMRGDVWINFGTERGLSNLFTWSVLEDSRHQVWAGTWGGGLFRLEGEHFVRKFDLAERGEPVTALCEFPAGTLWVGTAAGLMRIVDDRLERLAALGGAAAGDVRILRPGRNGELWIGSQGQGLGRLHEGKLRTFRQAEGLPRDFVLSLYHDEDGTLWIGTLDQGLCRYRDGRFDAITMEQGLPNNVLGHIEDDGLGFLWFSSQKGLFRASKTDLHACADGRLTTLPTLVYGKAEGMATLAGSSGFTPSGFKSADGRMWFPTARGIAVINPRAVRPNTVPPSVWIEEMVVDNRPAVIQLHPTPSRRLVPGKSAERFVELRPGRRQLDVTFTGISFTSPERVRFKYRLDGLDADWTEGSSRKVTYSFLPPGGYTFHVIASNSDGLWNQVGDSVDIIMLPHVWQTWWFNAVLVIAGFAAVGGAVYLESRRRHRRKLERVARERELERERARIAQDIHDDLGASLTRIGMLSELATEDLNDPQRASASLGQIYSTARDLTRAMDEIVWAVNPRHDTLDSLMNYITRFAHDFLSAAQIRCRLDPPTRLPELTVRSEIRHNLFLAFKETLNNAVKHSGATEVRVTLEPAPGGFKLVIADNGSGFDTRKSTAATGDRVVSGYGLAGIRKRLDQIGGRVNIHSEAGAGVQVELFVPQPDFPASLSGDFERRN